MYSSQTAQQIEKLVRKQAPLVKRIAHHLAARLPSHIHIDDLIQSGMLGLLEAARNYNPSKGASFETYAGIRIRGAMMDELRRGDWLPRSVHKNARRISEAIKTIEDRCGRDASDEEVAQELGMTLDQYFACLKDAMEGRLHSFEDLIEQGYDHRSDCQQSHPEHLAIELHFRQALSSEILNLPEKEKLVLSLYYEEELNLKEIGLVLNVSESRVSQIHSQATLRLRSRLKNWQV